MSHPTDEINDEPRERSEVIRQVGTWQLVTRTVLLDAEHERLGRAFGVSPAVAAIIESARDVAFYAAGARSRGVRQIGTHLREVLATPEPGELHANVPLGSTAPDRVPPHAPPKGKGRR